MIELENCPVCGANSFKDVYKAPYFRGDGEEFQIKECTGCQLWVTSPRPEDVSKYYETEDYISHTNTKKGLVDYLYHWVRSFALKSKLKLINRITNGQGKLLDYGSGTGYFLNTAQKGGWKVLGVEPSNQAREVAKSNFGIDLFSPEGINWSSIQDLDCLTMWHVLEHLPDLNEHVANFSGAIKSGGHLVVAVPNHESYDSKHYGKNWAALDVPLHLWHFKKSNIEQLAAKHGFSLQEVINMPFDSYYVSLLSEKIKTGKQNMLSAFWIGLKSNLRGGGAKNASSLIYILKKA